MNRFHMPLSPFLRVALSDPALPSQRKRESP
jgi:hypothetical protein